MSEGRGEAPDSNASEDLDTTRLLPIVLDGLEDHESRYVNLININHDRASFQVIFSQFMQPVISHSLDEERIEERGFVTAKVVARLVFTPFMIEQTIKTLQYELAQYYEDQELDAGGETVG